MENRKKDHIDLAFDSQTSKDLLDRRFNYEPLLAAHPGTEYGTFSFLGKSLRAPLWVSSMTGGTRLASRINLNLARACKEFGFGMGLGSCRIILEDQTHFPDFDMRDVIGPDLPLYANLGICQVEQLLEEHKVNRIDDLVSRLRADGLIIHVNPLQEWFQPEGDVLKYPPLDTIKRLLDHARYPLIVKEVGQGMGPASLLELMKLPLAAIEFGAFGGTNFAQVELLRDKSAYGELFEPLSKVGMDAGQMLEAINQAAVEDNTLQCRQLIISGGIKSFLDGYYYIRKSKIPAVYGQASAFLKYAREDYEMLHAFVSGQIKGLLMAQSFLRVRE